MIMNNLIKVATELKKMANKRHKDRYGPKPVSSAQVLKKVKVALQSVMDLNSLPADAFLNLSPEFKFDLEDMQRRLIELKKEAEKLL